MSGHATSPKRRQREEPEEHEEGSERWLVTYADMLTLLMVLFIVLFAISSVDQKKFLELKNGLADSFGAKTTLGAAGSGGKAVLAEVAGPPDPFEPGAITPNVTGAQAEKSAAQKSADAKKAEAEGKAAKALKVEYGSLEKAREDMMRRLQKAGLGGQASFHFDGRGLVVRILADDIVFQADNATLEPSGRRVLRALAPAIRSLPNEVAVEGHTDLLPVKPRFYASSWSLSAERAISVVTYFTDAVRLPERRFSATGYGEQKPLVQGTSEAANRANRRVEIVLLAQTPSGATASFADVVAEQGGAG
jgi:chemotaxis protein MotB